MSRTSMLVLSWVLSGCVEVAPDKAPGHSGDTGVEIGETGREDDSDSPGHSGSESGDDTSGETGVDTADTSDTSGGGEDSDSSVDSTPDSGDDSGDDTSTETDTATPLYLDLSTDADAKLIGEAADDAYSPRIAVAGGGDVNGDGHSDLLVGLVGTRGTGAGGSGSTYLVHGPVSGELDLSDADAELEGSDSEFSGTSVDLAGDVNGDGYADILIGAPYYSGPVGTDGTEGQAYVVLGPVTGEVELTDADAFLHGELDETYPDFSYTGCSVAIAGDTNGDGDADMLVGAYGYDAGMVYLILGPVSGIVELSDADLRVGTTTGSLGYDVSSAGDTNGDGLADILMGQPTNTDASVLLFTGPASGDTTDADADAIFAASADYLAGGIPGSAGDVDADGYDDVLMGIPTADDTGAYAGAAFLYLGPFSGEVTLSDAQATLLGAIAYGSAGAGIDGAGDIDGDGYADFAVSAPELLFDGPGTTWLFYGLVSGTVSLDDADVQIVGEGDDQAGWAIAGAGDVDADGLDDLLIGGPGDDDGGEGAGAAWLVLGSSL